MRAPSRKGSATRTSLLSRRREFGEIVVGRPRQFLKAELTRGPLSAAGLEEAAAKRGIGASDFEAVGESLGVVVSRANSGKDDPHAVTYSLPGWTALVRAV